MQINLNKSLALKGSGSIPRPTSGAVQDLKGGTLDGLTLVDKVGTLSAPVITDVPCLAFDGVNDWIDIPNITMRGIYSVSVCLQNNGSAHCIAELNGGFEFLIAVNGGMQLIRRNSPATVIVTDYRAPTGYHKLGFIYNDSTGLVQFLVDDKVSSTYATGNIGMGASNANLRIGARNGETELYAGIITYVEATSTTGSTLLLQLEESSGTTAYDVSGNGNNGTIFGGATWTTATGIPSYVAQYGFRQSGAVQIPALLPGAQSYTEWLIAEDALGLSGGTYTTTQVYIIAEAGTARANLISRGYSLTDAGGV